MLKENWGLFIGQDNRRIYEHQGSDKKLWIRESLVGGHYLFFPLLSFLSPLFPPLSSFLPFIFFILFQIEFHTMAGPGLTVVATLFLQLLLGFRCETPCLAGEAILKDSWYFYVFRFAHRALTSLALGSKLPTLQNRVLRFNQLSVAGPQSMSRFPAPGLTFSLCLDFS